MILCVLHDFYKVVDSGGIPMHITASGVSSDCADGLGTAALVHEQYNE